MYISIKVGITMRMKLGKPYHEVGFNNKYNSILQIGRASCRERV